ncbi:MAG TPA: PVC-type heme-binding CxxCH protein, partial [Methylomirabilota bacterium]|nr:PVC-type heme-binding CxxCH protein [Methylomirabilota bacterium]
MLSKFAWGVLAWVAAGSGTCSDAVAASSALVRRDHRIEIHPFAAAPDIVTPVGIAVDGRGRVFVVESHTHFPPPDYRGPVFDRVRVLEDRDGDGRADRIGTFAEGFRHAMNLAPSPGGGLLLTCRDRVLRLSDTDGDGVADRQIPLLRLDTAADYPHNGLGGLTVGDDGFIYVGLGENLGRAYVLRGTDGSSCSGGGEGGGVFRCRADGSRVERVATGFWNPFGLAFFASEFLLAVDNDPDARPPNRLLDVIKHGDYGYKFRHGRSGLHPFVAWNGELPGTLPMMAATGEAASGVLPCAGMRLPPEYRDAILVASWGDHRIEVYRPRPVGASLWAGREVLIEGDSSFRPVAMAAAPDGAVYITDWVDRDYAVHRQGRVWRLAAPFPPLGGLHATQVMNADRLRLRRLLGADGELETDELFDALAGDDPFLRAVAVGELSHPDLRENLLVELSSPKPKVRLGVLLALRRGGVPHPEAIVEHALADSDEAIRMAALIWAAEDRLHVSPDRLARALTAGPVSPALIKVHAAALATLAAATNGVSPISPPDARPRRLSLVRRDDEDRWLARLREDAAATNTLWRLEAVRHLAGSLRVDVLDELSRVAMDPANSDLLRAEALVALAGSVETLWPGLIGLLEDRSIVVAIETSRVLRPVAREHAVRRAIEARLQETLTRADESVLAEQLRFALDLTSPEAPQRDPSRRPRTPEQWRRALEMPGDTASGRRVFFNPAIGCARCHRVEDHGGSLGPDLSAIGRVADRDKVLMAVLDPSREIAPQFATHQITTHEGRFYSGLLLEPATNGPAILLDGAGQAAVIPRAQIASQAISKVSLMPSGLEAALSVSDFR